MILIPQWMVSAAELVRIAFVAYFCQQAAFSVLLFSPTKRESDTTIKYINIVVWAAQFHFEQVVNSGFLNEDGENRDALWVLGKGLPKPLVVTPGRYPITK